MSTRSGASSWACASAGPDARAAHVTLVLNGEGVVAVDLETMEATRGRPSEGYIGVQNHVAPVKFRNIRVKER